MTETETAGVELAIGVVTYNSASAAAAVGAGLRSALEGVLAGVTSCVVLADGGSTDGTAGLVRERIGTAARLLEVPFPVHATDLMEVPYHGVPARPRAVAQILQQSRELGARACLVVDPGTFGTDPDSIEALVGPVLTDVADFVGTYQMRHPLSGAIVKGVLSPTFRALYGVRLRQPVADTFACSARLVEHYLEQGEWAPETGVSGIDLRLPATAASDGFRLAEAMLGTRLEDGREATADLSTTLAQAAGALFRELARRPEAWQRQRRSVPVPIFGRAPRVEPPERSINLERLVDSFRLGYRELRDVWAMVLPPRTIIELKKLAGLPLEAFDVDDELWARILYDFAVGYHLRPLGRDHLLRSLAPLYTGWFASFVLQVRQAAPEEVDRRLERLCESFERHKPYLISRWRWPERTRTAS